MNMNWLESLLYGLISGFAEFVPVSSQAHQAVFFRLFGGSSTGTLSLMIHIGGLAAVIFSNRQQIVRLHREMRLAQIPRRRRRRNPEQGALMELSLLRSAAIAMLLGFLLYIPASFRRNDLNIVALMLLLNGVILYMPILFATGNKSAAGMSRLDSVLIGLGGCMGMLPGVSAVAGMTTVCSLRGGEKERSLSWTYLLMIPFLACLIGYDIRQIVVESGFLTLDFGYLIQWLLAGGTAFAGGVLGIGFMRFISVHGGYNAFAFYAWGGALFSFILYLSS